MANVGFCRPPACQFSAPTEQTTNGIKMLFSQIILAKLPKSWWKSNKNVHSYRKTQIFVKFAQIVPYFRPILLPPPSDFHLWEEFNK